MSASGSKSKEFFDLVKGIGECKSKQEEDTIMAKERDSLQQLLAAPRITVGRMKELLVRVLYLEMLGHDAGFAHISAVKMCNSTDLAVKRLGYLCVCLLLEPGHELMLLLVNTLQKDLRSDNHIEQCFALHTLARLLDKDLVPALLPLVVGCLSHSMALVQKKALLALLKCHEVDPDAALPHLPDALKLLCSADPSVMGAALHLVEHVPVDLTLGLGDSVLSILAQITEHRLPREYDYHRMPAPWLQMHLLRVLRKIGAQHATEVLAQVLSRADIGTNIGYSILYECIRTVTVVAPDSTTLMNSCVDTIGRMLSSDNNNLRYLGVSALQCMDTQYIAQHQLLVMECLESTDETLRVQTLGLLHRMTNPSNVEVITDKLLEVLGSNINTFLRKDLVSRVCASALRYGPCLQWVIETLNRVFLCKGAGDLVDASVTHQVMRSLAQASDQVQQYAVDSYTHLLGTDDLLLPVEAQRMGIWVLGEYGTPPATFQGGPGVRAWALDAHLKAAARTGEVPAPVEELLHGYQSSLDMDLQQRAYEFLCLMEQPGTLSLLHEPVGAVDEELHCLDQYVATALGNGARPYSRPTQSEAVHPQEKHEPGIHYEPYSAPVQPATVAPGPAPSARRTKNVWGAHGYSATEGSPVPTPTPPMVPAPIQPVTKPPAIPKPEPVDPAQEEKKRRAAMLFGGVAKPVPRSTRPAPPSTPAASDDLLNLFDAAPVAAPSTSPPDFLLDLGFSESSSSFKWTSGHSLLPGTLQQELDALPRSSASDQVVTRDSLIAVSSYTMSTPEVTIPTVFVQSPVPLSKVAVHFDAAQGYTFTHDSSPSATVQEEPHLVISSIPQDGVLAIFTSITPLPSATRVSDLSGKVLYVHPESGEEVTLPFSVEVRYLDLLRPTSMTTAEYGGLWGTLGHETLVSIPSASDTAAVVAALPQLFHVDTIGTETILAGKIADTTALLHCAVLSDSAQVSLRTRSSLKSVSDSLSTAVAQALASHQ